MKVSDIAMCIEEIAPLSLQEDYDNAGWQVGDKYSEATGALLCIDVTEEVVDEAVALGVNLIISHHPLLFKGVKSLTGKNYVERTAIKAIQHNISIYASHTNLDNAWSGVNFKMAEKLGLTNLSILMPQGGKLLKLVTYVPVSHADIVRNALFTAGCGNVG
ncbi:Nif3-like dinuclear metal center hexameric protein, partial [Coprobacter fastidiosus]